MIRHQRGVSPYILYFCNNITGLLSTLPETTNPPPLPVPRHHTSECIIRGGIINIYPLRIYKYQNAGGMTQTTPTPREGRKKGQVEKRKKKEYK